ncbi:MAG: cytochrome C biogenesis protein [Thermoanaerobaculia bacterium]|nr:MAG: cytochrome C biogenesis protein [Thermoanaerobaculia bacterium]
MSPLFGVLFWSCLVVYALTVGAQIYGNVFAKPRWVARAVPAIAAGFALHTALVAWRWIGTGHVPTIGNFENALTGAWFIVAMTLWAGWRQRYPLLAAGALPFALIILGGGAPSDTAARPMVAALQSFWLYIHIFFAWLAYGAYTVSCGAAVVYLGKSKRSAPPADAEALARLDELMFRATAFGFVTDAIMIASGAIWAKDLWGAYWSWDPVETWSLLSWLIYGLALHLRITMGWRGRRLAWLLVFAILGVLISFWGVNLVMEGSEHVFNVG